MPKPIERVTMFKIPKEDDREKLLNQYKVLKMTAFKVSQIKEDFLLGKLFK